MLITLVSTNPQSGKEIENAQYILNQTEKARESTVYIVSNSALMGFEAKSYIQFSDFESRQAATIQYLQNNIKEDICLIISVYSKDIQDFKPLKLTRFSREWGPFFKVEREGASMGLCVISSPWCLVQPTEEINLKAIFFTQEYHIQTHIPDANIPSLSAREFFSEKQLSVQLETIGFKYHVPVLSVPVRGFYNGRIYDGVFGVWDPNTQQVKFQSSHKTSPIHHLDTITGNVLTPYYKRSESSIEHILSMLCYGIQEYFTQTGFSKALIAISGGIDSALVTALCVKALGKERVFGIFMPGPFSSAESITDAQLLCTNLGISYDCLNIQTMYDLLTSEEVNKWKKDLTLENIQARLRGLLLMSYANEYGALAVNTCNKSEDWVGYATLYGDAVGAFAPIGDLYKSEVYELAEYFNIRAYKEIIPRSIFEKEPSAELKLNQKDSDTLPPYSILDALLFGYFEQCFSLESIAKNTGYSIPQIEYFLRQSFRSEYKRAQSPPVLNISSSPKETFSLTQSWV